jgi:hypothetical protein
MMELYITAQRIDESLRFYLLSVGPNPDPKDLGLSKTTVWENAYSTLDDLCKVVQDNCDAGEVDLQKLRSHLSKGLPFHAPISKETAVKMGFKI